MSDNPAFIDAAFRDYLVRCYGARADHLPEAQRVELQQAFFSSATLTLALVDAPHRYNRQPTNTERDVAVCIAEECRAFGLARQVMIDIAAGKLGKRT